MRTSTIKVKNTKAIKKLRQAQGHDISDKRCCYCMDSRECHICKGKGMIPTWDSERGEFKQYGGRTLCWNCKGSRRCPYCQEVTESA